MWWGQWGLPHTNTVHTAPAHSRASTRVNCLLLHLLLISHFQSLRAKYFVSSCCTVPKLCLFVTPWTAARQAPLSFTVSWGLLKFMSIESVMLSNHLILCCPLLLLPSIFPSIRIFSNESVLHIRWPKYWSFSISPSNEYSGQISFRIDWFDLLAVQGTLKSLLQHHSLKASLLRCSASLWSNTQESACNTGDWVRSLGWEDPLKKGKATH